MTFLTYRNGNAAIEKRIKAAVAAFYERRGKLPTTLVVHKSELGDARAAVQTLGLGLDVQGSGGCLVPEVWLSELSSMRIDGLEQGHLL